MVAADAPPGTVSSRLPSSSIDAEVSSPLFPKLLAGWGTWSRLRQTDPIFRSRLWHNEDCPVCIVFGRESTIHQCRPPHSYLSLQTVRVSPKLAIALSKVQPSKLCIGLRAHSPGCPLSRILFTFPSRACTAIFRYLPVHGLATVARSTIGYRCSEELGAALWASR